jgi:hypothetical protein
MEHEQAYAGGWVAVRVGVVTKPGDLPILGPMLTQQVGDGGVADAVE